jgi:ABC-2 type transport system permease protein
VSAPTSRWSDVRLVAGREVEDKLRSRSFVLSTLFFLLIVAASIALPALLADDGPARYEVATVGAPAQQLVDATGAGEVELAARPVADEAEADGLLRAGEVDAALTVTPEGPRLTGLQEVPGDVAATLVETAQQTGAAQALLDAGVAPEQVEALLAPPAVSERLLDPSAVDPALVTLLSVAFALLFFFVVFQFGMSIAQGVVQEKESRIVELLVSAVPVRTLLFGKLLGNGALALGQVVLLAAVAVAGAAVTNDRELVGLLLRSSGWFVAFFALGFAMLSCLWAAAGAAASRQEDLQSTTLPLQALVIVPFFAAVYVTEEGPLRTALSFIPLSAPLVMPARLVAGEAQPWEAAVAAALVLVAAVGFVLVGERLYRASLLRTRGRTSLADAWSGRLESAP